MLNLFVLFCIVSFVIFPQLLYNTIANEMNSNETVLADKYAGNSNKTASELFMHLFTGEVNIRKYCDISQPVVITDFVLGISAKFINLL